MLRFLVITGVAFFLFSACTDRDDSEVAGDNVPTVDMLRAPPPPRAPEPWQNRVKKIQAEFARNPNAPRFAKAPPNAKAKPTISANEASPVDGVMVVWYCDPNSPDIWDQMWMTIIGQAVKNDSDAWVYLQGNGSAASLLKKCGDLLAENQSIKLERVHFIQGVPNDAFWIRDFGPLFVRDRESLDLSVRDPRYYPGRPNDDAQPVNFANRIKVPVSDFDADFEGGNFLANGGGLCIIGSVTRQANPQYTAAELNTLFQTELGCDKLIIVRSLEDFATGHVDMWLSWVDRTTLIVGEYTEAQDSENREIIETNLKTKLTGLTDPASGEPIKIVRMPMPSNCPAGFAGVASQSCNGVPGWNRTWRTYLNVLEINGTVLLPTYKQDDSQDQKAIDIWEDAGFNVVEVLSDHIIPSAGSVHCITKSVDTLNK